jgi:hypothetical protein
MSSGSPRGNSGLFEVDFEFYPGVSVLMLFRRRVLILHQPILRLYFDASAHLC